MKTEANAGDTKIHPENSQKEQTKSCCAMVLFWLVQSAILIYVGDNFFSIYVINILATSLFSLLTSAQTLVIFFIVSCRLAKNKKEILCLYFLLDNTLVNLIFVLVSWNLLMILLLPSPVNALDIVTLVFKSISLFMYVGTFRILILYYKWSKCQVILTKLFLIAGCFSYVGISCQLMIDQGQSFSILGEVKAAAIKDFALFYTIALFTLYYDLYGKITDIDGTGDHKYTYGQKEEEESLKSEIAEETHQRIDT